MITWRAVYRDKKCLKQYNADGTVNRYNDIDRYRLVRFDLLKDDKPIASVYLRQGQRLIYRRRTLVPLVGERVVIHLLGWQKTIDTPKGKENITSLMYIHEDGSVALDGARNNLELLEVEYT